MRFFFYGTLLQGSCNPVAVALHRHLAPGLPATATGRLFAIPDPAGWYPAFLPDPAGSAVHGMIHAPLPSFTPAQLARIDAYEIGADGEFRREIMPVRSSEGTVAAQAYVYDAALPAGARPVPDGDFRAYLARHGLVPFR